MRDDQILVLGGLISDEQTGSKQKVPILGDLPLIGRLFSSDSTQHKKNNLMVFIHPVILRDDERAHDVSQQNYEYMQRAQEKSLQPPHPTTEKNFFACTCKTLIHRNLYKPTENKKPSYDAGLFVSEPISTVRRNALRPTYFFPIRKDVGSTRKAHYIASYILLFYQKKRWVSWPIQRVITRSTLASTAIPNFSCHGFFTT
jgi:hypothetical protein